jgi:molybdopterin/thiamine biosynthesis adenylyltransferase
MTASDYAVLYQHLFPGDDDEHGAVLAAGVVRTRRGVRLVVRHVFLARDGVDFVPGTRGYRMLTAEFVNKKIRFCRDEGLAYLAVHNHGGHSSVGFSSDDNASHERGYPALLDIGRGVPVGALVFATGAVAGDLWTSDRSRRALDHMVIVGGTIRRLYDRPRSEAASVDPRFDRQARLFGEAGQRLLAGQKVGIIGAGGVGMILVSLLARLGVGRLVVVDPDRIDITNLPRLPEARRLDALTVLTDPRRPSWLQRIGRRFATRKVDLARRVARRAQSNIQVDTIAGDVIDANVAARLRDCDVLLLAADTQQARAVFNALVHQYLIPGWQIGSKIEVRKADGEVGDVFSVVRPVRPDTGCLWCNEVINPARLAEEALDDQQRAAQRYVDEDEVVAPSVVTINGIGATQAVDDVMLAVTGLGDPDDGAYRYDFVREHKTKRVTPRRDPDCIECGAGDRSRLARGDSRSLPCRPAAVNRALSRWRLKLAA